MKVVILTDETYAAVAGKLPKLAPLKLPSPAELNKLGRNGGEPEAFTRLREQAEAIGDAQEQIREQMHSLLAQADAVGVKPGALARWSGYSARRVHQITREGS